MCVLYPKGLPLYTYISYGLPSLLGFTFTSNEDFSTMGKSVPLVQINEAIIYSKK